MQNFSLLKRAGRARKPVLLKRGMSATRGRIPDGRRIHHERGQLQRGAVRARRAHLRRPHSQHARSQRGARGAAAEPSAHHRRSQPRHRQAQQGHAAVARGGCGRSRWAHHRSPPRSRPRAQRWQAVALPRAVRRTSWPRSAKSPKYWSAPSPILSPTLERAVPARFRRARDRPPLADATSQAAATWSRCCALARAGHRRRVVSARRSIPATTNTLTSPTARATRSAFSICCSSSNVKTIAVGAGPTGVAANPTRNEIYVANAESNKSASLTPSATKWSRRLASIARHTLSRFQPTASAPTWPIRARRTFR